MFINRVSQRLLAAPELLPLLHELNQGNDATLAFCTSSTRETTPHWPWPRARVPLWWRPCGRATPGPACS